MSKGNRKTNADRGKIEEIKLQRPIKINGLNQKTGKLNPKKRSAFTVRNIEQFLRMLDGEFLHADEYKGKIAKYSIRIDCPVPGKNFQKTYLMFFDIDFNTPETIFTLTLYPG